MRARAHKQVAAGVYLVVNVNQSSGIVVCILLSSVVPRSPNVRSRCSHPKHQLHGAVYHRRHAQDVRVRAAGKEHSDSILQRTLYASRRTLLFISSGDGGGNAHRPTEISEFRRPSAVSLHGDLCLGSFSFRFRERHSNSLTRESEFITNRN